MAGQLHFWDDRNEEPLFDDEPRLEYPVPPEPAPGPAPDPTSLDRDLQLLYLDYLGQSAQRIATANETSKEARRAEYVRKVNYELAVGKLTAAQRDMLQRIVWGKRRYE